MVSAGVAATVGIAAVGIAAFATGVFKNLKKNERSNSSTPNNINKILTDDNRHHGDRLVIEEAIKEKDWETLEEMLGSRTSDFPDLIQMIKKALERKQ